MDQTPFFFHQQQFVNRRIDYNPLKLEIDGTGSYLYYIVENQIIKSLSKSPFGGFHLDALCSDELLKTLLERWLSGLPSDIIEVQIQLFPEIYDPRSYQRQLNLFQELGFEIDFTDITQYLKIEEGKDFKSIVAANQKKLLDQPNLEFRELDSEHLDEVYAVISNNLEAKGYPITMSYDEMKAAFEQFPKHYRLFGVFLNGKCIAGSVVVLVSNHILYDAFHGHDLNYSKLSPVVKLTKSLYEFAQQHGFELLDLGISTVKGVKNKGLYGFKKRLGAKDSLKPLMVYHCY